MDWVPLREVLRTSAAEFVDSLIVDPEIDRVACAYLALHREATIERLTDQAELVTMRRILAEHEQAASQGNVVVMNGTHGAARRMVKS